MIKFLLRKICYRDLDKESQDAYIPLFGMYTILAIPCYGIWLVIVLFPFLHFVISSRINGVGYGLSVTTKIGYVIFWAIYFYLFLLIYNYFYDYILLLSQLLTSKLYFSVCTKRGKAISKGDFKTILDADEVLHSIISTQSCRYYSYFVCFELCRILKKGSLEILAIKKLAPDREFEDDDGREYILLALYINNGWAFDPFSAKQFPIEEIHKIYQAKVYKSFDYNSICSKKFETFKWQEYSELDKWCEKNDCTNSMNDDEDDEEET